MGGVGLDGELEGAGVNKREARKALMSSRRAARSDLARELAEEVMDAPTEVRGEGEEVMSAFARREQRRMEARNEMEEEMFVRIPLSKVEKKRQAAQHRQVGALTQLADLGDEVADLVSNADALGTLAPRRRLDDIAAGLQLRPTVAAPSGDQDLPTREPLGERRAKFGRKAHALATMAAMHAGEDDDGDDAGPMEVDEDELYTQFAAKKAAKKEARDEAEGARENKPMVSYTRRRCARLSAPSLGAPLTHLEAALSPSLSPFSRSSSHSPGSCALTVSQPLLSELLSLTWKLRSHRLARRRRRMRTGGA
jgi:hypothetical protein